jgi:ferredoxin
MIIPPHLLPAVLSQAGQAYLRACPCRQEAQRCPPDSWEVCVVFEHASAADLASARPVTTAQALEVLHSPHAEGTIRQLFFTPDGEIVELCSCCTCCCSVLPGIKQPHGFEHELRSGWTAQLDAERCTACGACVDSCYFEARQLVDGRMEVLDERCLGCGRCVASCGQGAISLRKDEERATALPVRLATHPLAPGI